MEELSESYWNQRWIRGQTGWDIGYPSPAIVSYFADVQDKDASILIPGCGNAYEAKALLNLGFKDITILDISEVAIANLQSQFHLSSTVKAVHADFFEYAGEFDYIIEQTFFCALLPSLRKKYVSKMQELLKPKGILVGLLFNKNFGLEGPPFGGNAEGYNALFSPSFEFLTFEEAKNSIPPRMGQEFFIEFLHKLN